MRPSQIVDFGLSIILSNNSFGSIFDDNFFKVRKKIESEDIGGLELDLLKSRK